MPRSPAARTPVAWAVCRSPPRSMSIEVGFATTNGLKLQRDVIAELRQPGGRKSAQGVGAVLLGRTTCPAFSYRWFTSNLLHGDTKNPRSGTPAARRRRRRRRRRRHRPYRARHRHRRIDPLSRLRLRARLRPTIGHPGLQPGIPRPADRPPDQCGIRPSGAYYRRHQNFAGGDVGEGRDPWWVPAPLGGSADAEASPSASILTASIPWPKRRP